MQNVVHYFLHFIFPICIAYLLYRKDWKIVYLIFLSSMLIDLDHLLATPIFNPNRCSIGYHPMHSLYAILVYLGLLYFPKTRIFSIGLVLHIATDLIDCIWMFEHCKTCIFNENLFRVFNYIF